MTTTPLTPAQHAILAYAIEHSGGKIEWFPDNIKGSARTKVLESLFKRAMITRDSTDWLVAAEGYEALGCPRPVSAPPGAGPEIDAAVTAAEAMWATDTAPKPTSALTRQNSKQAQVIAMLKRPEGATIAQICEMTGWQAHTVRGTFAGAFKKKLKLAIISEKVELAGACQRVYRIDAGAGA